MKVNGYTIEPDADLRNADLRRANLSGANLRGANLRGADLRNANLSGANLRNANLPNANLSDANLRKANLWNADLSNANLSDANLWNADLSNADLRQANLWNADLSNANLSDANLLDADLSNADLSGVKGLLNALKWLKDNFKQTKHGFIVYKAFGNTYYNQNMFGKIRKYRIITEIVNVHREENCGCGINFATLEWIKNNLKPNEIRKCLLKFEDLIDTCIPYNTDGKARCGRLTIGERVI